MKLTREQVEGWKMNKGMMSPNEFRALCDLALKTLQPEARSYDGIVKLATELRDGFTYDPGHSDLDNEQPIHLCTTLGTWRTLNFLLGSLPQKGES